MFIWIWWRIVVLIARFLTHSVKLWWVVVSMFHLALRRRTYQPCKLIFSTRELVIPSRRTLSKSPSRIRMALFQPRIPHTTTIRVAHKLETQRDQERLSKWSKSHLSSVSLYTLLCWQNFCGRIIDIIRLWGRFLCLNYHWRKHLWPWRQYVTCWRKHWSCERDSECCDWARIEWQERIAEDRNQRNQVSDCGRPGDFYHQGEHEDVRVPSHRF